MLGIIPVNCSPGLSCAAQSRLGEPQAQHISHNDFLVSILTRLLTCCWQVRMYSPNTGAASCVACM